MPKYFSINSINEPEPIHNGFSNNSFPIDNKGFKLLTNFNKAKTPLYKAVIQEAKNLNLAYVDRLEVSETAYDRNGNLIRSHSALKFHNPNNELIDLNDFWRLFEKMSKDFEQHQNNQG